MLKNTRGLVALVAAAMLISGCGGGGGGASTGSGGLTPPGNPGGTSPQSEISQARTLGGAAVAAWGNSMEIGNAFTVGNAAALAWGNRQVISGAAVVDNGSSVPMGTSTPTPPACNNGVIKNYQWKAGNPNTGTLSLKTYFDAACTNIKEDVELDSNYPGKTGSGTATGSQTNYVSGNTVLSYQTLTISDSTLNGKMQTYSEKRVESLANGQPVFAEYGYTCNFAQYPQVQCQRADYSTIAATNSEYGYQASIQGQVTSPDPGFTAAPGTCYDWSIKYAYAGTTYSGGIGAFTLNGPTPAWNVTGGSAASTINGTANLTWECSNPPAAGGSVARSEGITLTQGGLTVNLNYTTGPGLQGTVTDSTGATVATMTLNVVGNGTIAYSNGTKDWVVDWSITGDPKTAPWDGGGPTP